MLHDPASFYNTELSSKSQNDPLKQKIITRLKKRFCKLSHHLKKNYTYTQKKFLLPKNFTQTQKKFRDPGSRGSPLFATLVTQTFLRRLTASQKWNTTNTLTESEWI